jgi:hypothetical protein
VASRKSTPPNTSGTEIKRSRSVSGIYWEAERIEIESPPPSDPSSPSIPWLSDHHRMLFDHFMTSTLRIFHDSQAVQQEIKTIMMPMATDTNHGFSLLAAIISLSATHRMNLGLSNNQPEIDYWRDMSIGHLRRPGVHE